VAGRGDDLHRRVPSCDRERFAVANHAEFTWNPRIVRREAGQVEPRLQLRDAADVVRMMMGDQDRPDVQTRGLRAQHRSASPGSTTMAEPSAAESSQT
jgi:hypothetical protein